MEVLAQNKPHLRSDTSQLRTPSVSDPEKILHKRNWKENQTPHTEIPRFSLEDSPSSSQLAEVPGPETTSRAFEYSPSYSSFEGIEVKDEAKSKDISRFFIHLTPEVEEIKEVTEFSTSHIPSSQVTSQAVIPYRPIVIHTSLPPPPIIHQNPPPVMVVPGFLLNKYAPLALPQVLNDMPQDYLKVLPHFNGEDDTLAQNHLEVFCAFVENFNVEHLDIVLRLFV